MMAINNLEATVRDQNKRIEELQKSLVNIFKNSNKANLLYYRVEVIIIIVIVAVLQALFLYYK